VLYFKYLNRGCHGFDWKIKYRLHAEGFGWPLKKAEKQLIANTYVSNKVVAFNFAEEAELAVAA
jgi:hypothetical protein